MNDWSSYPENGLHQGGMVQLKKWRLVVYDYAGQRTDRTCSVSCARVKWIDGWPMLGDEGKDLITYPKPATGKKIEDKESGYYR